ENPHNTRWKLQREDGAAVFLEAEYRRQHEKESHGLPGTYKAGAFYDTKPFPDLSEGRARHGDYGVYAIADQMLWREPGRAEGEPEDAQGFGVFARASWVPEDRNFVHDDFEFGASYTGLIPRRDHDVVGFGAMQTKVSDDARQPDGRRFSKHRE